MQHRPTLSDLQPLAHEAARFLRDRLGEAPPARTAIVTGSGLGALTEAALCHASIEASDIPGLGGSTVQGHGGLWHQGELAGRPVLILEGRRHLYEGIPAALAAFPIAILACLGVDRLILTNAAGGLSPGLAVGDLMLLDDHINLMTRNPLTGPLVDGQGPRFPDMSQPYDPELCEAFLDAALDLRINLKRGVYAALTGPNYETAAEVRMLRLLGADAVGMSTVPEVIAARQLNMRVAAVSLITNSHVADTQPPSHDEVLQAGRKSAKKLAGLLTAVVNSL